jgi:hypothetical protein
VSAQTAFGRKRRIAVEGKRLAGMALPALTKNGPLRIGRRGVSRPFEEFDRMALGTRASGELPTPTALRLNRDDAVLDRIPAEDLQKLLQLATMWAERVVAELARQIETGCVYLVHEDLVSDWSGNLFEPYGLASAIGSAA